MKQECKVINFGNSTTIICGSKTTDHKCNEDAVCYDTSESRFFFKNSEEAAKWYDKNYKKVLSGSVACSICRRAVIDNAIWL